MLARSCCLFALLHVAVSNDRQDAGNFFAEFDHLPTSGSSTDAQERPKQGLRAHFRRRQHTTPELRRFSKPGLFPPLHKKPQADEENKDNLPSNQQSNGDGNMWKIIIDEGKNVKGEESENAFPKVQKDLHMHDDGFSRDRHGLNTRRLGSDKSSTDLREHRSRTNDYGKNLPEDQLHLNFRRAQSDNTFTKSKNYLHPERYDYDNTYVKDKIDLSIQRRENENKFQKDNSDLNLRRQESNIYSRDQSDINSRSDENNNKVLNYPSDSFKNENANTFPIHRQNLNIQSYGIDNKFSRDQSDPNSKKHEYDFSIPKNKDDLNTQKYENGNQFYNENNNINDRRLKNNHEYDNVFSNTPKNVNFQSPIFANKGENDLRISSQGNENKFQKDHQDQTFWGHGNYNKIVRDQNHERASDNKQSTRNEIGINARNNENINIFPNDPNKLDSRRKYYEDNTYKNQGDLSIRNDENYKSSPNHKSYLNSQIPESDNQFRNDANGVKEERNYSRHRLGTNNNVQEGIAQNPSVIPVTMKKDDYANAMEPPSFRQRLALGVPHRNNKFSEEPVHRNNNQDNSFFQLSVEKKAIENNPDLTKEQNVPNRFLHRGEKPHFLQDHYKNWMHEPIQFPHISNAQIRRDQNNKDATIQSSEDGNSDPGRTSSPSVNDFLTGNEDSLMYIAPKSTTSSTNGILTESNKKLLKKHMNTDENENIKHGHFERSFKDPDGTFLTDSDYPFLNKDHIFGSLLFQNNLGKIPMDFPETFHTNENKLPQEHSSEQFRVSEETFLTDKEEDPDFRLKPLNKHIELDNKPTKEKNRSPDTFLTNEEDSPVFSQRQNILTKEHSREPSTSQEKPPSRSEEYFLTDEGTLPPKKEAYRTVTLPPTSTDENRIPTNDDFLKDDKPLLLRERYQPKNIGRVRWPPPKHAESSESNSGEHRFFEPLFYEDFKPSPQGPDSEDKIKENHQRKSHSLNPKKKYSDERTNDDEADSKQPDRSEDERPPIYEDHHPFLYFEDSSERPPQYHGDRDGVNNANNDAKESDEENRDSHFDDDDDDADDDDDENHRNNKPNDSEEESKDAPLNELESEESPRSKPDENVEKNTPDKSSHDYDQEESPPHDNDEKELSFFHSIEQSHHPGKSSAELSTPPYPHVKTHANSENGERPLTPNSEEESPLDHGLETPVQEHSNEQTTPVHSDEEQQPNNSNEESHNGHSHEEPPLEESNEESPHSHSHEELSVQNGDGESPHGHSQEERPVQNSNEESPHGHSHEERPVQNSNEESPHGHSHEEPPVQNSNEESPHSHSHEEPPVQNSNEETPHGQSHEEPPVQNSNEETTHGHSHEEPPVQNNNEESPHYHSHEEPPEQNSKEELTLSHSQEEPLSSQEEAPQIHTYEEPTIPNGHSKDTLPPPKKGQQNSPHSEESLEELPTPSVNAIDSDEHMPEENDESREESEEGGRTSHEEEDKPPLDYDERPPDYESIKPTPEYEDGGSRSEEQASGSTEGGVSEESEDYEDIVPGHSEEETDYEEGIKPTTSPAADYEDSSSKPSGEQSEEEEISGSPEFTFDSFEFPADVMESPLSSGKDLTTTKRPASSTLRPTSLPEDCSDGPTTPRLDLSKAKRPTNTVRTTSRPADEVTSTILSPFLPQAVFQLPGPFAFQKQQKQPVSITAGDNVKMSEGGTSTSTTTPRPASISAVGVVKPGGQIITKLVRPTTAPTTKASSTSRPTLRPARIRAGLPFGARVRASPGASSSTTVAPSTQQKAASLATKEATALTYLRPPPLGQQHSWLQIPPPTSPLVRLFVG